MSLAIGESSRPVTSCLRPASIACTSPCSSLDMSGPASEPAKEPTILDKIYAQRVKDVEVAKNTPGTTWDDLQVRAFEALTVPPSWILTTNIC